MSTFLQAAASYFGINPDIINKSEMYTAEDGAQRLVVEIKVSDNDVLGVADRMKVMREVVPVDPQQAAPRPGDVATVDGGKGVWLRPANIILGQKVFAVASNGLGLVRYEDLTDAQKMHDQIRSRGELKTQWQSLSKDEQAKYGGSWHNYLATNI